MSTTSLQKIIQHASQTTLSVSVAAFVRVELAGRSQKTIDWYQRLLGKLVADLGDCALADVSEYDLLEWGAGITRTKSPYTAAGYIRAARRLFRWLAKMDILPGDVSALVRKPRLPRSTRRGVNDGDADRLIQAASSPRDNALLRFLESTGCRRAGAARLRWCDLSPESRQALVTEKGDKERVVFYDGQCGDALSAWRKIQGGGDDDLVFGLGETGVSQVLRRMSKRLGIRGASPHQWRHRWARRAIMAGMDLSQAAQILGHESVVVTERFYGQFNTAQLREAYERSRR